MPKEEKLKAYLVTYTIGTQEDAMRNCVIIAYSKQEAGDIFVRWLKAKHIYEIVEGVIVQPTRKTKRNAHMFTNDFYKRQNDFVTYLENKRKDNA